MFEENAEKDICIQNTMQAINIMFQNIGDEMMIEDLEKIQSRHETLIEQCKFWLEKNNTERYIYDLKDFANWLFDFLGWEDEDFNDG
jgi:hypothetical protein